MDWKDCKCIMDDLQAGQTLMSFKEIRHEPQLPRWNGKPIAVARFYEWVKSGLETVYSPYQTTIGAVVRYMATVEHSQKGTGHPQTLKHYKGDSASAGSSDDPVNQGKP